MKKLLNTIGSALVLSVITGCVQSSQPVSGSPAPAYPLSSKVGQTVKLAGTFDGWASCFDSGAKTRSDWVLRYADQGVQRCVFVTGGAPQGIVLPPSTASFGMPVQISGMVKLNEASKPYVQFDAPAPVSGKP